MNEVRGGGDPLRAMYFVAAVLMGLASLAVVLLMFVPRDTFSSSNPEDIWVPGSGPGYDAPIETRRADEPPVTAEEREELHHH
jgi:hypothetical protein